MILDILFGNRHRPASRGVSRFRANDSQSRLTLEQPPGALVCDSSGETIWESFQYFYDHPEIYKFVGTTTIATENGIRHMHKFVFVE